MYSRPSLARKRRRKRRRRRSRRRRSGLLLQGRTNRRAFIGSADAELVTVDVVDPLGVGPDFSSSS
jgi:hypothetical protein